MNNDDKKNIASALTLLWWKLTPPTPTKQDEYKYVLSEFKTALGLELEEGDA